MKTAFRSVLVVLWLAAASAQAEVMSVQVKNGQLRDKPSYLGKVLAPVAYGDRLTVAARQGEWVSVTAAAGAGWIHQSALTAKKVVLKAGAENVGTAASGEELALAGKGFNSDVEADFKSKNKNIDFTWIDRMEKIRVAPAESQAFLKEGGLL
jgi:hypothetical protein